jgi:hypothetical protein
MIWKWKRFRSRCAEFISPVRLGCRPRKRTGQLGSELSGSVIDSQTAQNLIHTAIESIPMAKQ